MPFMYESRLRPGSLRSTFVQQLVPGGGAGGNGAGGFVR